MQRGPPLYPYLRKFLTVKEFCSEIGISKATFYRWEKRKITCFRTLGNHRRIPIQEVSND